MNSIKKQCNSCGKSIATTQIARHQGSHNIVINCQYCPLSFNRKDNYQRHLKEVHGEQPAVLPEPLEPNEFLVDQTLLTKNITNFQVHPPIIAAANRSADFEHPFTCKVMGPRGTGKTSFAVSYIQQIGFITFHKIFIVTASPDQPLFIALKDMSQVYFITLDELEGIIKCNRDVLVVLDDVMKEARYNIVLETLHTRGRHQRISIISLEQDLFYSSYVERRNVDYFLITRIRDKSCLQEFYKRFCSDISQWRFITLYDMATKPELGYIIIDFKSLETKYRINSFNSYFSSRHNKLKYINGKADDVLREMNKELKINFINALSKESKNEKYGKQLTDSDEETVVPVSGWSCYTCKKEFLCNSALREHQESEHPSPPPSREPTHICSICGENFYTGINDIRNHMQEKHSID